MKTFLKLIVALIAASCLMPAPVFAAGESSTMSSDDTFVAGPYGC